MDSQELGASSSSREAEDERDVENLRRPPVALCFTLRLGLWGERNNALPMLYLMHTINIHSVMYILQ